MDEVNEQIKKGKEDVEQGWEVLKQGLTGILNEGKREAKRMNKKRKEGREIEDTEKELKKLKEERKRSAEKNNEEMKKIKKKIEMIRKKKRKIRLKEKIRELETCYQERDAKRYWDKLKELGGWRKREERYQKQQLTKEEENTQGKAR